MSPFGNSPPKEDKATPPEDDSAEPLPKLEPGPALEAPAKEEPKPAAPETKPESKPDSQPEASPPPATEADTDDAAEKPDAE